LLQTPYISRRSAKLPPLRELKTIVKDLAKTIGKAYKDIFKKYVNREISLDELKEFQYNPDNYRLEIPSVNRSNKYG
jgi:hypothetical protein